MSFSVTGFGVVTICGMDAELVTAARQGDRDAFAQLVHRHQRVVLGVALSITRDRALAEDIGQEAFVAAWKSLGKLDDPARVAPWLAGIARNLAHNAMRKQARRAAHDLAGELAASPTPLDDVAAGELRDVLREALDELPVPQREALVLYYLEDRSVDHVAAGLGVSKDVVKQRLHRAREAAREVLTERLASALVAMRPAAAFTGGVIAAISLSRVTDVSAATTSAKATGGKVMFAKLALAAGAAATAGGATVYAVSHRDSVAPVKATTTSSTSDTPHSIARRSASVAAHQKLVAQIAAARKRRAAMPELGPTELEHVKDYLSTAFIDLKPLINECLDDVDIGASVKVRCNVSTEPDVGAVISSSEIVADGTTIHDPEVLDCVRETIASVELDPAEVPGDWSFETLVEMRGEDQKND